MQLMILGLSSRVMLGLDILKKKKNPQGDTITRLQKMANIKNADNANAKRYSHCRKSNIHLPYDPAILLLVFILEKGKLTFI